MNLRSMFSCSEPLRDSYICSQADTDVGYARVALRVTAALARSGQ